MPMQLEEGRGTNETTMRENRPKPVNMNQLDLHGPWYTMVGS